ncbi:MAG TPA: N-acetylmuramoyl-L-alanine amidase [Candidatus Alistipes merdigallinarum]|nr:N-acetylmuramoyl-L-alanine amidase [Candidatus Alistipes merdigallinarum]
MKVSNLTILTASIVLLLLFGPLCNSNGQNTKIGINTVAIDAGHGGKDAGAVGRTYKEKDINLAVALRLGKLINENYPDVKVVYTRKTDVFIPLNERGQIANKAGADLFISIHINSAESSSATGTSTYVMGVDKTGANLKVAMKENDVITYEEDYSSKYQGYKPGSPESFIIFSLMQFSHQSQSILLADMVQKQFNANTNMRDRGVRQAGFLVLWSAAMPSILAEFGFISNSTEEKFIGSEKGRDTYAKCLFNAFSEYKTRSEGHGTLIVLDNDKTDEEIDSTTENGNLQEEDVAASGSSDAELIYRIQVASADRKLPKNAAQFKEYRGKVTEIRIGNLYKYYVEEASTYADALNLQRRVRKSIKDAFMVPFIDGKPISVEEARKRENP